MIGYENRALRREDFNNDKVDAGEIGAGHTVTAIYEIALKGQGGQLTDPLRYQSSSQSKQEKVEQNNELAFLRLRYKQPDSDYSTLMETPILKSQLITQLKHASERYKFAASVAGFGQLAKIGMQFTGWVVVKIILWLLLGRICKPRGTGEYTLRQRAGDSSQQIY